MAEGEAEQRVWAQYVRDGAGATMIATVVGSRVAFVSDRAYEDLVPSPRCVWKIWSLGLSGDVESLADGVLAVEAAFDQAAAADAEGEADAE